MKILHVAPFFHPHIGGVEKHVLEISKSLAESGHSVSVFTVSHEKDLPERKKIENVSVIRAPFEGTGYFSRLLSAWRFLAGNRKEFASFDIVHLHDFPAFAWVFFLPKRKTITFHGFERDPPRFYNKALRKIAEHSVQSNFCVGKYLREFYGTSCPDNHLIVGGVDSGKFSPAAGKRRISDRVVFIGRFEADTNPLAIIESLAGTGLGIDFYGSGSLEVEMKGLAKSLRVRARFLGKTLNPEKILPKYRVAFASKQLSILEALSCGCSVFSIHSTPMQKAMLLGMGLSGKIRIFERGETGSIGNAVKGILARSGREWNRAELLSRKSALPFSWGKIAESYLLEYRKLPGK